MSNGLDFSTLGQRGGQERDNCIPRFYTEAVKNNFRSLNEGRAVFEDREMVEIIIAGDSKSVVNEIVTDNHRQRWAREYNLFKDGKEAVAEGTPVEEWAAISKSQAMELRSCHVRTVEQLANLSDNLLSRAVPMGGHALRERAKAFLSQAGDGAELAQALATVAEQQAQISALKKQVEDVVAAAAAQQQAKAQSSQEVMQ
jgi:hypothetical protein